MNPPQKTEAREFWISPDRDAATEVSYENGLTEMVICFCADVGPIDDDSICVVPKSDLQSANARIASLTQELEAEKEKYLNLNESLDTENYNGNKLTRELALKSKQLELCKEQRNGYIERLSDCYEDGLNFKGMRKDDDKEIEAANG